MAVVGRDSSTTPIAVSTLRTYAQSILQEYMICISPSSFSYTNPVSLVPYPVGAQYMAAAVLGMYAARDVSVPLTRKLPAGFQGPYEARSINDAALDSAAGLFVVDNYLGNLRCRHSVTTLPNDPNKRESSVVRAKYEMALQLKYALDQSVVGVVISNEEIPTVISSAVSGILAQLVTLNIIDSYQGVLVQQNANDPTIVNVQFMYAPLYPINQIQVVFTINTSNGDFTLTQT